MGESRQSPTAADAVVLIRQALVILDELEDHDVAAAHLQQAIDRIEDHQSKASPRA